MDHNYNNLSGTPQGGTTPEMQNNPYGFQSNHTDVNQENTQNPYQSNNTYSSAQNPYPSGEGYSNSANPYQSNNTYGNTQNPYPSGEGYSNSANPYESNNTYSSAQNPYPSGEGYSNSANPYQSNNAYGNTQNPYQANAVYTPYDATQYHLGEEELPTKNFFVLRLIFSIIEMIAGGFIFGLIGCIFNAQANSAYRKGDGALYKSKAKVANVLLIIGGVFSVISLIATIVFVVAAVQSFSDNLTDLYGTKSSTDYYSEYSNIWGDSAQEVLDDYYIFEYEGYTFELPMDMDDFLDLGFDIDFNEEIDFDDYQIAAGDFASIEYYDPDGIWMGYICLENMEDDTKLARDCVITGISIIDDGPYGGITTPLYFMDGISFDTSYEDVIDLIGEPDDIDDEDSDDIYYTWYPDSDNTYDNYIMMEFEDGEFVKVSIYYNGEDLD